MLALLVCMSIWIWPPQPLLYKSSAVWRHLEPQKPNSCVCVELIAPGKWYLKGSSVPHLKSTYTHKHTQAYTNIYKQTHTHTHWNTHTDTHTPKPILIQMKSLVAYLNHFMYNRSSTCLCFTFKLNLSTWRNRLEGCEFSYSVLLWFFPSVIQPPWGQIWEEELEEMWVSNLLM